jgi:hypothetical protein
MSLNPSNWHTRSRVSMGEVGGSGLRTVRVRRRYIGEYGVMVKSAVEHRSPTGNGEVKLYTTISQLTLDRNQTVFAIWPRSGD